jgi:hypothetical protein
MFTVHNIKNKQLKENRWVGLFIDISLSPLSPETAHKNNLIEVEQERYYNTYNIISRFLNIFKIFSF